MVMQRYLGRSWLLMVFLYSCSTKGPGCTDTEAYNRDPSATENDGSCLYNSVWVEPCNALGLSGDLAETSGLVFWDGLLWTQNDNSDTRLFGLDPATGEVSREYYLEGVVNTDWEELSQDEEFIYIGDFGNNSSGNRTDLHILRIGKESLLAGDPLIDTIGFSYSDQIDFSQRGPNQTDFDCEAFVVSQDSIFLFTKQWLTTYTSLYSMPKVPGKHVAHKRAFFNLQGLVTGAEYFESKGLLVLCAYDSLLHPFLYLFYDYKDYDFFSGNKRKIDLRLQFTQVEGVASPDGLSYYISNETFIQESLVETFAALRLIDLSSYLESYLQ
jgi:hypothetical protein